MPDAPAPAATAARAIAAALIRHAITAAGTALVAHGYVDQGTVNDAVSPIADEVLGVAVVVASAGWSVVRAHLTHSRWAAAWAALNGPSPRGELPNPSAVAASPSAIAKASASPQSTTEGE